MTQQIENTETMYGYPMEHHEWAEIVINRDLFLCNEFAELYQANNLYWSDNLSNMYCKPDYSKQDFITYLEEQGFDQDEIDEELEYYVPMSEYTDQLDLGGCFADFIEKLEDEREPQEVYQWYIVGPWLAEKLIEIGEPVLETDSHYLWGRTCCGQAIILDGTFQEIKAKLEKDIEAMR